MKPQEEINTKDLLGIYIDFENCEGMFIPNDILTIHKIEPEEIDFTIQGASNIKYDGCYQKLNGCQRINEHNDIVAINFKYKNGVLEYKPLWWENSNPWIIEENNKYQKSFLAPHSDGIHVVISKDVLKDKIQSMRDRANELELSIS